MPKNQDFAFEELIASYCAPALAGIKPSNIVSCRKCAVPDAAKKVEELNHRLNSKDIYFEILCECEKRALIMVYRKKLLKNRLNQNEDAEFLRNCGYPQNSSVREYIKILKQRLSFEKFPHEIGVFLGYPLYDIKSFINHPHTGVILTGEWKVYHKAEEAKKIFSRYRACKKALANQMAKGKTLAQIFCAA